MATWLSVRDMHDWTVFSLSLTLGKVWPLSFRSVGDRREKAPVLLSMVQRNKEQ